MIRTPFRTPLLRKSEESGANGGVSEPQAKKRRISSDEDVVKTMEPRLVFKTPGISSIPRKPLMALKNPAVTTISLDEDFRHYYNVLWYIFSQYGRVDH